MSVESGMPGERLGPVVTDDEQETNGHVDDRDALLGHLRDIHHELKTADHYLDLEIPGYQGLMAIRFRPYNVSKSEKKATALQRRMEKGEFILLDSACDGLIDACDQILVRKSKTEEFVPLDDEIPIKFDVRLGELFGIDSSRARDIVKGVFPTEQSIIGMSIEVTRWLRDVTQEVDEDFLGES